MLRDDPPTDLLSRAEERLLEETFEQFGHRHRWKLVDYVHTLPEWQDPKGSSVPISIADILRAVNASPEQIEAVAEELGAEAASERALQPPA
ncbi:MAG: hypothetical protein ACRD1C_13165 [Terriglobales bacterium]